MPPHPVPSACCITSTPCRFRHTLSRLHVVLPPHPATASIPCHVYMLYYRIDFISYLMGYLSAICLFSFIVISPLSDHKRCLFYEKALLPREYKLVSWFGNRGIHCSFMELIWFSYQMLERFFFFCFWTLFAVYYILLHLFIFRLTFGQLLLVFVIIFV